VGWIQTTAVLLNVGFDRNNNNRDNIFYNLGQEWTNSSFNGSLMIRPVLGKRSGGSVSSNGLTVKEIQVFPNPASDFIRIELPSYSGNYPVTINIFNLQGGLVYQNRVVRNENIPVQHLSPGMYLIRAEVPGLGIYNAKLLITR
jgi:hypothetical protein